MRYRHPQRRIRLALTSGHVAYVDTDWTPLDDRFQQEAVLKGCEVEQNIIPVVAKQEPAASEDAFVNTDEESILRRALIALIERNEEGDFTTTGLPNIRALEKIAGTQVNKGEAYRIFREMKNEAITAESGEGA